MRLRLSLRLPDLVSLVSLSVLFSGCQRTADRPPLDATCTVERVADGDTITCREGERIRIVGIDAPELDQPPFGVQSRDAFSRLAPPGTALGVELAADPRDDFDRTLAYLWDGDALLNEQMIRDGWAVVFLISPNVKYADRFRSAEEDAMRAGRGHWGSGGFVCRPVEHRRGRC